MKTRGVCVLCLVSLAEKWIFKGSPNHPSIHPYMACGTMGAALWEEVWGKVRGRCCLCLVELQRFPCVGKVSCCDGMCVFVCVCERELACDRSDV